MGWRRTARLEEPQKFGPSTARLSPHFVGFGLSPIPRAAKPHGSQEQHTIHRPIPQDSSSVQAVEACGAHSNVSCGPPLGEASARATLRVAEATPHSSSQFCRVHPRPQPAENEDGARAEYFGPPHPGAAGRPLSRGLSYSLSSQIPAQSSPQFSVPCQPMRLRFRSATFSRALRDSFYFGSPPK